jgi:DNA-binding PadR family transcriptional regulator
MRDLTEFQKNVLTVLVGDAKYGLEVKEALERYYRDEVNHGRLYPNLDKLVDEGYVEKRARDERTNEYVLTDEARDEIRDDILWRVENYVDGSDERASDIRDAVDDM